MGMKVCMSDNFLKNLQIFFLKYEKNLLDNKEAATKRHQAEFDHHVAALVKKFGGSPTENTQISLNVIRHNINEENKKSKKLGFEIEKFDLIIDVRSPDEFKTDHIPNSVNMPVLSNDERKNVGTVYSSDQTSARGKLISKKKKKIIQWYFWVKFYKHYNIQNNLQRTI